MASASDWSPALNGLRHGSLSAHFKNSRDVHIASSHPPAPLPFLLANASLGKFPSLVLSSLPLHTLATGCAPNQMRDSVLLRRWTPTPHPGPWVHGQAWDIRPSHGVFLELETDRSIPCHTTGGVRAWKLPEVYRGGKCRRRTGGCGQRKASLTHQSLLKILVGKTNSPLCAEAVVSWHCREFAQEQTLVLPSAFYNGMYDWPM